MKPQRIEFAGAWTSIIHQFAVALKAASGIVSSGDYLEQWRWRCASDNDKTSWLEGPKS